LPPAACSRSDTTRLACTRGPAPGFSATTTRGNRSSARARRASCVAAPPARPPRQPGLEARIRTPLIRRPVRSRALSPVQAGQPMTRTPLLRPTRPSTTLWVISRLGMSPTVGVLGDDATGRPHSTPRPLRRIGGRRQSRGHSRWPFSPRWAARPRISQLGTVRIPSPAPTRAFPSSQHIQRGRRAPGLGRSPATRLRPNRQNSRALPTSRL
jgi:hypothetical protein